MDPSVMGVCSRALFISEICSEICLLLKAGGCWRDLAAFGRTCLAVSEPAFDILWLEILDMDCLLDLIPALRRRFIAREEIFAVRSYDISRPIVDEDWTRFDFYARRVRHLNYPHNGSVDCSVFKELLKYRAGPLLPALRSLKWSHIGRGIDHPHQFIGGEFVSETLPFITSSLREIQLSTHAYYTIQFQREDEVLQAFLDALPSKCPSLETLSLFGSMTEAPLSSLGSFRNLKTLSLKVDRRSGTAVDSTTLIAVSSLETLESLSLWHVHISEFDPGSIPIGFPSLRSLSIFGGTGEGVVGVLEKISSPSFRELRVEAMSDECRGLLLFVAALPKFASSFQTLDVMAKCDLEATIVDPKELAESLIDPLLLRNLNTLVWNLESEEGEFPTSVFTDEQIFRMSTAWPDAHTLDLTFPRIRFSLLHWLLFARRCEVLSSLFLGEIAMEGNRTLEGRFQRMVFTSGTLRQLIQATAAQLNYGQVFEGILDRLFTKGVSPALFTVLIRRHD
ncbi:hypothetical protein JAAARDRAFT_62317 [Jaapia argillacea MUCL 33604]|uniref:F-box domain-containing protein n=1 Tax=Jaapia argillacea MUCL 33604 TaxID=933084 RepID=A0A067PN98_9AGAM|nr:hypothetical protein JAAARDRAFT_62317 [Jaapia argillacea MUCL 33604]